VITTKDAVKAELLKHGGAGRSVHGIAGAVRLPDADVVGALVALDREGLKAASLVRGFTRLKKQQPRAAAQRPLF
jgi:hypothetical protein